MCLDRAHIHIDDILDWLEHFWKIQWKGASFFRAFAFLIFSAIRRNFGLVAVETFRDLSSQTPVGRRISTKFYNFARNFAELESNGFKHRGTMITLFKAYIKSWCENDENLVISESEKRAHPQIPNPKMSRIHPIGRRKTPSQFFVEYFIKGCGFIDFWWFYSSLRDCSRFCTCFSILLTISVDFCRFHVRFNW